MHLWLFQSLRVVVQLDVVCKGAKLNFYPVDAKISSNLSPVCVIVMFSYQEFLWVLIQTLLIPLSIFLQLLYYFDFFCHLILFLVKVDFFFLIHSRLVVYG